MKYESIGLEETAITGSINSVLTIRGRIKLEGYSFKALVDKKEVDVENIYTGDAQRFCIKVNLPKGAGNNVDQIGQELVSKYGKDILEKIAKLSFKNTERIIKKSYND